MQLVTLGFFRLSGIRQALDAELPVENRAVAQNCRFFYLVAGSATGAGDVSQRRPPRAKTYNAKPAASDDLVLYDLLGGDGQGSGQCVD